MRATQRRVSREAARGPSTSLGMTGGGGMSLQERRSILDSRRLRHPAFAADFFDRRIDPLQAGQVIVHRRQLRGLGKCIRSFQARKYCADDVSAGHFLRAEAAVLVLDQKRTYSTPSRLLRPK